MVECAGEGLFGYRSNGGRPCVWRPLVESGWKTQGDTHDTVEHTNQRVVKTKKPKRDTFNTMDFPGGPPPQYYPGPTRFNFGDRTGSGGVRVVWSNVLERVSLGTGPTAAMRVEPQPLRWDTGAGETYVGGRWGPLGAGRNRCAVLLAGGKCGAGHTRMCTWAYWVTEAGGERGGRQAERWERGSMCVMLLCFFGLLLFVRVGGGDKRQPPSLRNSVVNIPPKGQL